MLITCRASFSHCTSQAWKQFSATPWNPLDPRAETQLFPDDKTHLFNGELGQENPIFQAKWQKELLDYLTELLSWPRKLDYGLLSCFVKTCFTMKVSRRLRDQGWVRKKCPLLPPQAHKPARPSFAMTTGDQGSAGMATGWPVNLIMVFGREKDDTKIGHVAKQVNVPACRGDLWAHLGVKQETLLRFSSKAPQKHLQR